MAQSFKARIYKYLHWWLKKSHQSKRWLRSLVVIGLCIGLWSIATFFYHPANAYDKDPYPYYPLTLECKVVNILDGDTIIVECPRVEDNNKKSMRIIRLWGIDAPETDQEPWGKIATDQLKSLIENEEHITVVMIEQDRYQRMIGKLYVKDVDIGLQMVTQGVVAVYHRYNNDQDYKKAEKKAKMARLGIWQVIGAQQNPEQWRRFNP